MDMGEYTICSDGIRRKIHKLNCACEDCQENRALIQRWQEDERREWAALKQKSQEPLSFNRVMDTKTLVVGQKVSIFGCGFFEGTVVNVTPDGVGVASDDGFAQFDKDGKETEASRSRRVGGLSTMPPEWQAWELRSLDEVEFDRNVTSWLLEFLKSGEKPADEIFKEAEKTFGNAGDQVRRAFDTLGLTKRQENDRWYWSLRWELDENNRVLRMAPSRS